MSIGHFGPKSTRHFGPRIFGVFFSVTTNLFWCTCSPRGDASVTGKMVRDASDLGKMGEVANY